MRCRVIAPAFAGLVLAALFVHAQEGAAVKVGDWVSYKQTIDFMGKEIVSEVKQTVTAKDEKFVTLKTEADVFGMKKESESKVAVEQFGDPAKVFAAKGKGKMEKKDSGKETITVGGQKYACEWTTYAMTADAGGKTIETNVKIWTSREVPLTGLVKMETDALGAKVKMELSGSGRGK